jgi:hypothetical protein
MGVQVKVPTRKKSTKQEDPVWDDENLFSISVVPLQLFLVMLTTKKLYYGKIKTILQHKIVDQ